MKTLLFLLLSLTLFAAPPRITSPLSMQELNKIMASDAAANDHFGRNIAISGDTVVVGASAKDDGVTNSGAVYIYERNISSGLFEQKAKLTASDAAANDYFGSSVAISGDTVLVGAAWNDDNGSDSGAAYLFEKPATGGWVTATEDARFTASDAAANDHFGISVAISGDTVVIGADWDDDNGASASGSVYLFEKPASGGWTSSTENAKFTASDAAADDYFGKHVAISGDTVVVGAEGDNNATGAAYLFEKPASGGWISTTEKAKLTASDASEDDQFGISVAISGDTVVIGASGDNSASGSAYIFEKPVSGWISDTEDAKLNASDATMHDNFGYSVAISGDSVVVGAWLNDDGGSAYLFEKPVSGWGNATENTKFRIADAELSDYFGFSVAINGGTVVVGANQDDEGGTNSGAAYLFNKVLFTNTIENKKEIIDIEANDPENDAISFSIIGGEDGARFSIDSGSGLLRFTNAADYETPLDVNHDNIYKLMLKVEDDIHESSTYHVLVRVSDLEYEGKAPKAISFEELNALRSDNATDNAYFGNSVAISGDTAVIGAEGFNGATGTAYIYERNSSTNTFMQIAQLNASDSAANNHFGISVAISGDIVVVGASGNAYNGSYTGAAYLFEKPDSGWISTTETLRFTASDGTQGDTFGTSVAICGNVVVVGGPGDDNDNGSDSGSAYLFEKPVSGWINIREIAKLTASDAASYDYFGSSVAISGDTVVVSTYYDDGNSGSAYLFEKPVSGWASVTENAKFTASDAASGDNFGGSIAISGDTIIVGASMNDSGSGSAYLYEKPVSGWRSTTENAKFTASDATTYDYFGKSVAIGRDIVVIGAPYGGGASGSAYLFEKPASGWANATEDAKLTASDGAASDYFGSSVAISGDTVVVGAHLDDDGGMSNSGASYIYKAKSSALNPALMLYLLN